MFWEFDFNSTSKIDTLLEAEVRAWSWISLLAVCPTSHEMAVVNSWSHKDVLPLPRISPLNSCLTMMSFCKSARRGMRTSSNSKSRWQPKLKPP